MWWLVWKKPFWPFLTQPGPTFWHQKGPNMEFLTHNFNFQSLRKTKAALLPSMWPKDWLTEVKTSKIITFCYFWAKMDKHFILISLKYSVSSYFSFQFPLRYFYNHCFLLVNVAIPHSEYEKNPMKYQFLCFYEIGPNLTQILSERPQPHYFFWLISNEICWGIQLKLITCVAIQQFCKKLVKPLKNCFLGPICTKKGVIMGHTYNEKKFFLVEITKAHHQLSETFYFIKINVLTELQIFFYLEWCFLSKKSVISS